MNFTRRSKLLMEDDSFVISDSDEEVDLSKSSSGLNKADDTAKDEVIADSDFESR